MSNFAVKCEKGFYKASYDSFGGNWTHDASKAKTWRTADGAGRTAEKQKKFLQLASNKTWDVRVVSI